MILGFINLGKYLELKAKQRSSLALEKLLDLAPKQAVIFEENIAKTIPAKAIKPQMRVQALTGDRLAVDGILDSGSIWVDESMLTGEALPVEKKSVIKCEPALWCKTVQALTLPNRSAHKPLWLV